jgi:hypothetical protein
VKKLDHQANSNINPKIDPMPTSLVHSQEEYIKLFIKQ